MAPKFIPAVASQSFGRAPHHRIEEKLSLCAEYGFEGVEIFMEDIELVAQSMQNAGATSSPFIGRAMTHDDYLLAATSYIGGLCKHHNLFVICLQPFANYEGLKSRAAHASRIRELHLWIRLAKNLSTDLIQIPSSYLPATECTSDHDTIVADLREVCDIGLTHAPPIRFAHEALSWATHHSLWTDVWDLVLAVDRPNFGTCLDTFNLLGREYADPASPSGKAANAEEQLATTLQNLRTRLDPTKIFYIEAVDGERLHQPLVEGHEFYNPDQVARMSWSRNARLFPLEERGYLPVLEVLKAIEDAGYEGYVSFEFFSRTAHEPGPNVPREHAERAQKSWRKLCSAMDWEYDEKWSRGWLKSEPTVTTAPKAVQNLSSPTPPRPRSTAGVMTAKPPTAHKQNWATQVLQAH